MDKQFNAATWRSFYNFEPIYLSLDIQLETKLKTSMIYIRVKITHPVGKFNSSPKLLWSTVEA